MKKITAKELTNEEKARLVIGKNTWHNEDLGGKVPVFMMSDGPVGVRHPRDVNSATSDTAPSIAYPCFEALSQTWNLELANKLGKAIANDCMDLDIDVILGPGVNIKRLPINGRNFEYLSEDPLLAGLLAKSYIEGVQNENVGACLKHYCCNNTESSRNYKSMDVSTRALREIYLKPFEIASKAKPWEVMCSYNLVNGCRMSENKKLYNILRNEFGFDGLIVSDWGAVMDREKSLNAGLDLEMPYSKEHLDDLLNKIKEDQIDLDQLNTCAQRVIDFAFKAENTRPLRKKTLSTEDRYDIAREIANEGIVLLKNENNVLPLNPKEERLLVSGAPLNWYVYGGGSSEVTPLKEYVKLLDALKEEGFNAKGANALEFNRGPVSCVGNLVGALNQTIKENITTSIVTISQDNWEQSEGYNRQNLLLSNEQVSLIHEVAKVSKKTVVIIYAGAPIEMGEWIDEVDAVIWASYTGEKGNESIAKILSGKVNPSGKTSETFPLLLEDFDSINAYEDARSCVYEEDLNVGYRQFVTDNTPVLFPFGYGLSYSNFEYDNLKLSKEDKKVIVEFDVTNTSNIDGKEVAEVYVEDLTRVTYRPKYELKGFEKALIKAKQTKHFRIELGEDAFQYYSTSYDKWTVNHGVFKIMVGKNCLDIELEENIEY